MNTRYTATDAFMEQQTNYNNKMVLAFNGSFACTYIYMYFAWVGIIPNIIHMREYEHVCIHAGWAACTYVRTFWPLQKKIIQTKQLHPKVQANNDSMIMKSQTCNVL